MTLDEAVAYVHHARRAHVAAYAFVADLTHDAGTNPDARLYIVAYDPDDEPTADARDDGDVVLTVLAGAVNGMVDEEATYAPVDVPLDTRLVRYQPTTHFDEELLHYTFGVVAQVLAGTPLAEALEAFDDT